MEKLQGFAQPDLINIVVNSNALITLETITEITVILEQILCDVFNGQLRIIVVL